MWLMYPVLSTDVRQARQGVVAMLAASAVWYLAAAGVVAISANDVMFRVRAKFQTLPDAEYELMGPRKGWFYALCLALAVSAGLRYLGYQRLKNIAEAVSAGDGIRLGILGLCVTLCTPLVVPLGGLGGLLALVMVAGAAVELQFLRVPAQLFGLVVSPAAAQQVARLRLAWLVWLVVVALTAMVLLVSQGVNDLPRSPGSPTDKLVASVCSGLCTAFYALAVLELLTVPILVGGYWLALLGVHRYADRLTDPRGAVAAPPPPDTRPINVLKDVLQNPYG